MISDQTSQVSYAGNGSLSTPYPITFRYDDSAWVLVEVIDADGEVTELELGTDYTLTGNGATTTGNVVTGGGAIADTSTVRITRETLRTQTNSLPANGAVPSPTIEAALDKLTMTVIDLWRKATGFFNRSLRVPDGETVDELDAAADRAEKYLGFDADGAPVMKTPNEILAESDGAPEGIGLPSGGTIGHVLTKTSSTDYATEWRLPSSRYFIDCEPAFLPLLRAGVRGETCATLWASDSTWASQSGIPRKFADWWAGEFPDFRVEYAVPNAGFDNLTTTVVQAANGPQCWHWYTGDIWGPAIVHTAAADTPVGATTSPVRLRARYSFDAVNGSGWPTTTYNLGGWGSTNRTYLYITATGRLGLLFYNGTTLIDPGASTNTLPALTAGTEYRFRATLVADDGAGGKTVHYEYSTNGGVSWSSLSGGTPQTQATATLVGDPGGTWYYWIGGWGGNAVAGAKCYGFNVDLHDGTNYYPILPERIDWLQPGDGQTTLSPELEGSPTLFIDNLSSSGSGVTRPTHWLVGTGADYLWDNRHALVIDRGQTFAAVSSSHNDVGASGITLARGLDTLKTTLAGNLGVIPKFVVFTQNPESDTYPYLGPAHQRRQAWLLAYAAASRDAGVDINLMYLEEEDDGQAYIEAGGVHPTVADGYPMQATKFNAAMKYLKDTRAS